MLDAAREGAVRILNHPGAAVVEAPAMAAFMPSLCRHLLGDTLRLPTMPTVWMADEGVQRMVAQGIRAMERGAGAGRVGPAGPAEGAEPGGAGGAGAFDRRAALGLRGMHEPIAVVGALLRGCREPGAAAGGVAAVPDA